MSVPRFANAFRGMIRGEQMPELCAAYSVSLVGSIVLGITEGVAEGVTGRPFTPTADMRDYVNKAIIEVKKS